MRFPSLPVVLPTRVDSSGAMENIHCGTYIIYWVGRQKSDAVHDKSEAKKREWKRKKRRFSFLIAFPKRLSALEFILYLQSKTTIFTTKTTATIRLNEKWKESGTLSRDLHLGVPLSASILAPITIPDIKREETRACTAGTTAFETTKINKPYRRPGVYNIFT